MEVFGQNNNDEKNAAKIRILAKQFVESDDLSYEESMTRLASIADGMIAESLSSCKEYFELAVQKVLGRYGTQTEETGGGDWINPGRGKTRS